MQAEICFPSDQPMKTKNHELAKHNTEHREKYICAF